MKKNFSKFWKSSKQPRKQRKYLANAPMHLKKKFMSVNLQKDLRKKYGKRNVSAKKGDRVKIMRGKFKGKEGKIVESLFKKSKIIVEGVQVSKRDGSKANVKIQPSNLQIIELNMEGKRADVLNKAPSEKVKTPKSPKKMENKNAS
ncbi:50S ribosomal protein L24 [Candidatus Pacearchaeota archaeon]|nr:50S ribosomal protein L24 [Candidatus Pacearchaeota archaeon]